MDEYPNTREILEVKAHLHVMHACPLDREGVGTELVSAEELDAMPKRSRSRRQRLPILENLYDSNPSKSLAELRNKRPSMVAKRTMESSCHH